MTKTYEHLTLSVELDTGNAAMIDDPYRRAADALEEIARRIRDHRTSGFIRDDNGNTAGNYVLSVALADPDGWEHDASEALYEDVGESTLKEDARNRAMFSTRSQCPECRRVFDLTDEIDAEEWSYGHDCEA